MTPAAPHPTYDLAHADHDYPARRDAPARSILLCSHPRSGSTLLGEALYFAGGLGCPLEYFHSGFRPGFERRWGIEGAQALIDAVWRKRTDPDGTLSVKLFWRDVAALVEELAPGRFPPLHTTPAARVPSETYREIGALLDRIFPRPIYLHLRRNDIVRQAVSGLIASKSGEWRAIGGGTSVRPVAFDFARIDELVDHARFCQAHWDAYFGANDLCPHRLAYEHLVADYRSTVDALLRHLDHPGSAPPARLRRQADALTEAMVVRYIRETAMKADRVEQDRDCRFIP